MSDIVEVMADGIRNVIDTGDRSVIEAAARCALAALSGEGWVVVERKPTKEKMSAIRDALAGWEDWENNSESDYARMWADAVTAASDPSPIVKQMPEEGR